MIEKIKGKLVLEIENKIKEIILNCGQKIVDIDIKGGTNKTITVFLYGSETIDTQKLESISKTIYPVIEDIPYFKPSFNLELSTPGIFRKIKYFEEFNIFTGRKIKIVTAEGFVIFGVLESFQDETVNISLDGQVKSLSIFDIKSAMLNG